MPGSEFRILPSLPLEYKKYRTIFPGKLGAYMTKGWQLVASLNYNVVIGEGSVGEVTRFLIGKDPKQVVGRGPLPQLSFPQPEPTGDPKDLIEEDDQSIEEEDEEEEVEDEEEEVEDDVKRDMDELLGGDEPKSA
jgi:hypothetical protein